MWEAVGDRWDMEVELCSLYVSCSGETCTLFKLGMLDKGLYVFMQHTVKDLPALNLPDVCTETPAYGQAFCQEHCDFLSQQAPNVPTGLRDFLRFKKRVSPLASINILCVVRVAFIMGQFHVRRRNAINVTSRLEYIPGVRFAWSSMADSCVCTLPGGIASMETVYTI